MSRQLVASSVRVEGATTFVGNILSTVVGANEVQTLQVTGSPTGGSFVLQFMGYTITLTYNSSVSATQTAFNSALGSGAVVVAGGSFPSNAQTVTFSGSFWGGMDVDPMSLITNSLTGGSSPNVTITPTSAGGGNVIIGNARVTTANFGSVFASNVFASNVRLVGSTTPLTIAPVGAVQAIEIKPGVHTTAKRAGITLGSWLIGQDVNSNGTLDFFWWNGSTRLLMAADGTLTLMNGVALQSPGAAYRIRVVGGPGFSTKHVEIGELYTASGVYGSSGDLHFSTASGLIKMRAGADPTNTYVGVDSSANLLVGGGITNSFTGSNAVLKAASDGSRTGISVNSGSATGTPDYFMAFYDIANGSTPVGSIQSPASSSSTNYNTTSDYRLKGEVVPLDLEQSLNRIMTLRPVSYIWTGIEDSLREEGFLAHEVADVIPSAVSGERDAVDENGEPVYQQMELARIVPVLTSAVQALGWRIRHLESQIG